MNWLTIAFAFVFFTNLLFMVGVVYALMRILDATQQGEIRLQKAASEIIEVGTHVKVAVRRAFSEMERGNENNALRDSSTNRAVADLSFQVKNLMDQLRQGKFSKDPAQQPEDQRSAEDLRAKLHAELNAALAKNHQLQEALEQGRFNLKGASQSHGELREEIREVKGVKQSVVDSLLARAKELEDQLAQATDRAKKAERHAEDNARQLDDIRAQISEQKFAASVKESMQAPEIDQSELIQSQQDQIDVLSAREAALMARIDKLENAFERTQTEKNFIEERFLKLDADSPAAPPANAAAPDRAQDLP